MRPGSDVVVVPDGCGQCQEPLHHSSDDPGLSAPAMVFEVELTLQGVVDRLDDLAERLQEPGTGTGCSPRIAGRSKVAPWSAKKVSSSALR